MAIAIKTSGLRLRDSNLPLVVSFAVAVCFNLVFLLWISHYEGSGYLGVVKNKGRLVVEVLKIEGSAVEGGLIAFNFGVRNVGEAELRKSGWSVDFLLSKDDKPSADDVRLGGMKGDEAIGVGEIYDGVVSGERLPLDGYGGYFVIAVAGDGGSEKVGGWYKAEGIDISAMVKPDLVVADMDVERDVADEGVYGVVSYRVKNRGHDSVVGRWRDVLVLSRDRKFSGDDVIVGERKSGEGSFLLPTLDYVGRRALGMVVDTEKFEEGSAIYLLVVTDVDGEIDEGGREGNNSRAMLMRLGVDEKGEKRFDFVKEEAKKEDVDEEREADLFEKNEVVLGSDDGGVEPTVAWISYEQFVQEVRAEKSRTHQPALQNFVRPRKDAPLDMFPTGEASKGGKEVGGRVALGAGREGDSRRTFDRGKGNDQAAKSGLEDGRLSGRRELAVAKNSFVEGDVANQFQSKSDGSKGDYSIDRDRKESRLAAATDRGRLGVNPFGLLGGRDSLSLKEAEGEHRNLLGKAQTLDAAKSDKGDEAERARQQKAIKGEKDLKGKSEVGEFEKDTDTSGQRGKAEEGKGGRRFNPKSGEGEDAKKQAGKEEQAGDSGGKVGRETSVPLSRGHVDVTSLTDSPLVVRLGKVLTVKGIVIDPVKPYFGRSLLVGASKDPEYELTFDYKTGKVVDVIEITSTGYAELDNKIELAMFRWKARGKELKKMKNDFSIKMKILIGR